jgi:hypothetical protein
MHSAGIRAVLILVALLWVPLGDAKKSKKKKQDVAYQPPKLSNPSKQTEQAPKVQEAPKIQEAPKVPEVPNNQNKNNRFANFCSQTGLKLADGSQNPNGFCSETIQGAIPKVKQMPSSVIVKPEDGANLDLNAPFRVEILTQNLQSGFFDDIKTKFYATPQTLNKEGVIQGHQHITIQRLNGNQIPNAQSFDFFHWLKDTDQNGVRFANVDKGLRQTGTFRICTFTGTSGYQPVIMAVAQRGSQDDCIRITVSNSNNNTNNDNKKKNTTTNSTNTNTNRSTNTNTITNTKTNINTNTKTNTDTKTTTNTKTNTDTKTTTNTNTITNTKTNTDTKTNTKTITNTNTKPNYFFKDDIDELFRPLNNLRNLHDYQRSVGFQNLSPQESLFVQQQQNIQLQNVQNIISGLFRPFNFFF